MAERTSVTQIVQLGVESTEGTAVAANRLLPSLKIEPAIQQVINHYRALGYKFPTVSSLGKNWSAAKFSGVPTYDELVYLLSSVMGAATPAQISSTTAYTWAHALSSTAEDTVKTFTVEQGSALRAHKAAGYRVVDFELTWDRDKVEVKGLMVGKALTDGITLTSSPTAIPQVPITGNDIEVWADDTSAGLGTTKLERTQKGSLKLANRFGPLWVVDRAQTSFVAQTERPIDAKAMLWAQANAEGMGFYTLSTTAGGKKFIRVKATSDQNAGTANPYSAQFDFACTVDKLGEFGDDQDIYGLPVDLQIVHDATWGKAIAATVVCKRTAL